MHPFRRLPFLHPRSKVREFDSVFMILCAFFVCASTVCISSVLGRYPGLAFGRLLHSGREDKHDSNAPLFLGVYTVAVLLHGITNVNELCTHTFVENICHMYRRR